MIPTGEWSCQTKPMKFNQYAVVLPEQRIGSVWDTTIGPNNIQDTEGRLDTRWWMASVTGATITLHRELGGVWTPVAWSFVAASNVLQVSLAFDGLGKPTVAYTTNTGVYLYFFDSQSGDYLDKFIGAGRTPVVGFDMKVDTGYQDADTLLLYVDAQDSIQMRIQRDRFDIDYTCNVKHDNVAIRKRGNTTDGRFQVEYTFPDTRDGTLLTAKCLETEFPLTRDLRGKNVEIGFTISNAPTWCDIVRMSQTIDWSHPQFEWTIFEHAGSTSHGAGGVHEGLFGMGFVPMAPIDHVDRDIAVLVYAGESTGDSIYSMTVLPDYPFQSGTFVLKLETFYDEPNLRDSKRITLSRNGIQLFEETSPDLPPLNYQDGGDRNRLRFGATALNNNDVLTQYWHMFPATFTDIWVKIDGVTTTWANTTAQQQGQSTPAGNPMTLRRRLMPSYIFPTTI